MGRCADEVLLHHAFGNVQAARNGGRIEVVKPLEHESVAAFVRQLVERLVKRHSQVVVTAAVFLFGLDSRPVHLVPGPVLQVRMGDRIEARSVNQEIVGNPEDIPIRLRDHGSSAYDKKPSQRFLDQVIDIPVPPCSSSEKAAQSYLIVPYVDNSACITYRVGDTR